MDLLVHPKSVWLIVYPGGYCGEFLAYWLSLHDGCVSTGQKEIGKNRYIGQHEYNYVYRDTGTKDLLFLTSHPGQNGISKIGFAVPDPAQHLYLYASERTHKFYFLLFLIKTVFYKHSTSHPPHSIFNSLEDWQKFEQYLNGRSEFTAEEAETWIKNVPRPEIAATVAARWKQSLKVPKSNTPRDINIDQLFFGDFDQAYAELCYKLNITVQNKFKQDLCDYHQRNVDVVEKYTGMSLDAFLDLDADSTIAAMTHACLARENENYFLV